MSVYGVDIRKITSIDELPCDNEELRWSGAFVFFANNMINDSSDEMTHQKMQEILGVTATQLDDFLCGRVIVDKSIYRPRFNYWMDNRLANILTEYGKRRVTPEEARERLAMCCEAAVIDSGYGVNVIVSQKTSIN